MTDNTKVLNAYCDSAFRSILDELQGAREGNRNEKLNACAYAAGRLIHAGTLNTADIVAQLLAAAITLGLDNREALTTIKSGLEAGQKNPRDLSHLGSRDGNMHHAKVGSPSATDTAETAIVPTVAQEPDGNDTVSKMEQKLVPITGTSAHTYLLSRALPPSCFAGLDDLRFAKDLPYHDDGELHGYYNALVARVRNLKTGKIIAHQRTYLNNDGSGKAAVDTPKKATAAIAGGVIYLGDVRMPTAVMAVVGEGIEDCLTGRAALGLPAVALMGMGMFKQFRSWPALRELTILVDAGDAAMLAARQMAARMRECRVRVRLVTAPSPHKDLNELLQAEGLDAVRRAIAAAPWLEPLTPDTPWSKAAGRGDYRYDSTCVADVTPQNIEWLWEPRIAIGKLSIIFGNPGQGKSQLTAYLAAHVTTGKAFADGAACAKGSVIMIACEDDVADTIRPRLTAAGADLRRVHILKTVRGRDQSGKLEGDRMFNLADGIEDVRKMIDDIGDVRMLVIDPVTAYLDGTDSHKNSDVRGVLLPIQLLAAEKGLAVVMVTHMNKAIGQDAMARVTGSGAFVAASRAAFLVGRDPNDPDSRVFVIAKNNLGDDRSGLGFKVESCVIEGDIKTSRVVMDGTPLTISADDLVSDSGINSGQSKTQSAVDDAKEWLADLLGEGRLAVSEIMAQAKAEGISEKSVRGAMRALGIKSAREGFGKQGVNYWSMPTDAA